MATVGEAPSRPSIIGYVLGGLALAGTACNVDLVPCNRSDGSAVGRHRFHCGLGDPGRAGLCMDPPAPVARCAAARHCCGHLVRRPARRCDAARLDALTRALPAPVHDVGMATSSTTVEQIVTDRPLA